jgi:shikimate kinase
VKACVPLLVLIGPPGAGKTRIGKRVAKLLEAEFIDTDQRIVAEHGKFQRCSPRTVKPIFVGSSAQ